MAPHLSICIPTRNRAALLRECLRHLKGFTKLSLEVIVCDNASDDDTGKVVREFEKNSFARFAYRRHASDIGPARNMESALRLGRAPYLWVLSDDDIAYESALAFIVQCLDRHPGAVAMRGGYTDAAAMEVGADRFTAPGDATVIARGDLNILATSVHICDSHPVMRREAFQRHCRLEARGFGLFPLYAQLLRLGDILHVDRPVIDHLMNADSLSSNMTEHWFVDFANADIEVAMAGGDPAVPLAVVERARSDVQGRVYLQAARMARMQADPLLMRHFVMRAKAIHRMDEASLVQWESAFLLDSAAQRLGQMLEDLGAGRVYFQDLPLLRKVTGQASMRLPQTAFVPFQAARPPRLEPRDACVSWEFAAASGDSSGVWISFLDVLDSCRVTRFPLTVDPADGAAVFHDVRAAAMLASPTHDFRVMMLDYGTAQ